MQDIARAPRDEASASSAVHSSARRFASSAFSSSSAARKLQRPQARTAGEPQRTRHPERRCRFSRTLNGVRAFRWCSLVVRPRHLRRCHNFDRSEPRRNSRSLIRSHLSQTLVRKMRLASRHPEAVRLPRRPERVSEQGRWSSQRPPGSIASSIASSAAWRCKRPAFALASAWARPDRRAAQANALR